VRTEKQAHGRDAASCVRTRARHMSDLVAAEGALLEQVIDASFDIWHEGLSRAAYPRFYAAQLKTAWGRDNLTRWALVDGTEVLASAKMYRFKGTLEGRDIEIVGLGAVFTQPRHRGRGHARVLAGRLLDRAASDGADLALLFSEIGPEYYARLGFTTIATTDLTLLVIESTRRGAPATLVRSGEERDLSVLAEMGRVRAAPFRFHLDRDRDLVYYAVARKRLLAGLGPPGARDVQFFIAEEGASAVAYVVISVRTASAAPAFRRTVEDAGADWILEEAGDRDPSGARVGAILQALIARDPAARRPTIRGWLPAGFRPPQVQIIDRQPSPEVMMMRPLTARGTPTSPLTDADVLYWHGDLF
jgi:predicted N-acetyltransferase YhbS